MTDKHSSEQNSDPGFFYRPEVIQWILRVFYAICVVLVVVDFLVHRHIVSNIEKIPAFYAIYGFIACVILVLIATEMRKMLMREEHYYEKGEGSAPATDEQADNDHGGHH